MTTLSNPTEATQPAELATTERKSAVDAIGETISVESYSGIGTLIGNAIDAVRAGASEEDCFRAISLVEALGKLHKFAKAMMDINLIERINADGELAFGDIRYYVGAKKKVKCTNVRMAIELLLAAAGGDLDRVCDCLASDALKHGESGLVLSPADFGKVFETKTEEDLKTGKPIRGLHRVDKRFVK